MGETTLDAIDELLQGVLEETDDPDTRYKLNSARQLVEVVRSRHTNLDEAIHDAVDDQEVLDNLVELGYLD